MSSARMARPYRIVLFAAATAVAIVLVAILARPLLVLFAGVLFAVVLRAVSGALSRASKAPYGACLGAVVLALVALGVFGAVTAGPTLAAQLVDLATQLPAAADQVLSVIGHASRSAPVVGSSMSSEAANVPSFAAQTLLSSAAAAVGTTVEVVGGLVVIFFVGVYGAAKPEHYVSAVVAVAPAHLRQRIRMMLHEIDRNVSRWLLGRLVAMVFVGVTCAIAFSVLGVPLPIVLGVLAGLLTFIAYIGAIVSAIPPLLLAFTKGPATAVAVLAVYTVLHVIEGYVLTPLLARVSVRFPPALTLAGQVLLGALVGPLGLTFATPLFVAAATAVRVWRRQDGATAEPSASAEASGAQASRELSYADAGLGS